MNHQGLFFNVQCVSTVVERKQLNFKSPFLRSNFFLLVLRFFNLRDEMNLSDTILLTVGISEPQ